MRIASRYLATVRRAISIPSPCNISTNLSSERIFFGDSASIRAFIRVRTASAEMAPPPSALALAAVKNYFGSTMPRGGAMNLFEVTRLTVLSCISMASAISRRTKGLR